MKSPDQLRDDALTIWQAGIDAVRAERLMREVVQCNGGTLTICGRSFRLADLGRIAVVGAGKAGAGMAAAAEEILGDELVDQKVTGWVNVPADCVRPLRRIHLHAARPAGVNEPTHEGVAGALRILEIVSQLQADDLCLVLLSGGGSALLPAPVPQVTLADKQAVTRFLMHAGATIAELNTVRKRLSRIKGGSLARSIRAGTTMTLIISDVVGDPLETIASGPTVADDSTDAGALSVLQKFASMPPDVPQAVLDHLAQSAKKSAMPAAIPVSVSNHIIGNNADAVAAAAMEAARLGYAVYSLGSETQGEAGAAGRELADLCRRIRDTGRPVAVPACVLSGGEPVVHLVKTDRPRKGGRNQQLVLAAIDHLLADRMHRIVVLSGGTDGEDGPTDAAGAWGGRQIVDAVRTLSLSPRDYLDINNAYAFFELAGGLIKTGPTHTNVMDLRVGLIGD